MVLNFSFCIKALTAHAVVFSFIANQTLASSQQKEYDFQLVHEWKQIEYKFRSEAERSEAIENGTFNVGKIEPIDAQYTINGYTGDERIFISTPRLTPMGVPAVLGIVTDQKRDGNPIIDPYPSWSWQLNPEECNYHRIVSIFRLWVDECDRLWLFDTGEIASNFICSPQILVFDLNTDTLLYKYEVPYEQYQNVSIYVSPTVEVEDPENKCENTWLYVPDTVAPALLVYSLKQNTSWKVQEKSFEADPNYTTFTIEGDSFSVTEGIVTVALSPASDGPYKRTLHYHALSSIRESWVYVKDLKNQSNFEIPNGSPHLFHTYSGTRNQQSSTEAFDRKGNLYFSLLIDVELAKWNRNTPYQQENFEIISTDKTMQVPSGLKILPHKNGKCEALWVFAVAYQRYAAGTLFGNRTNFRLFVAEL